MLANYFTVHSDLYFQLLNGDKDLLRFAHKALKKEYFMARFPTAGGAIFEERFCGFAFVSRMSLESLIIDRSNMIRMTTLYLFMLIYLRRCRGRSSTSIILSAYLEFL